MKDLFKAGDEVGSMWGDGVIAAINNSAVYGVQVQLDKFVKRLSKAGMHCQHSRHPSIWHKETGTPPSVGERPFEYPIYKKNIAVDYIVRFNGLRSGEVVESHYSEYQAGHKDDYWAPHTDRIWIDCEAPKWKPTEPTWCWVPCSTGKRKALILQYRNDEYRDLYSHFYTEAEPCDEKDIPQWWKDYRAI